MFEQFEKNPPAGENYLLPTWWKALRHMGCFPDQGWLRGLCGP